MPKMNVKVVIIALLVKLILCTAATHQSLEEARQERQRLINKHIKTLNKEEGALRLVGGDNEFEGNVEILHDHRWGSICDDEWDAPEAQIVCKQLGAAGVQRITHNGYFGPARRRFWMDNLYCQGHERELINCHFEGWGESDCRPSEAAGVICELPFGYKPSNKVPTPDVPKYRIHRAYRLDVRLNGARTYKEGRVEVSFDGGRWGSICSDGWSLLEANVVCKQLGLGYAREALQTDYFGGSNHSNIVLSGTECYGNESSLADCLHHDSFREGSACHGDHNHVAVVVCDHLAPDLVLDYEVIEQSAHLEDRPMQLMQCAMEENCVANAAYDIQRDDPNWLFTTRRLLKFTASSLNAGNTDFRPFKDKSLWEWHMCHMHFHSMEVFATFDIFDLEGHKVAQGHKASFCLEDNECNPGVEKKYDCSNFGDQGISVNCSDIYLYSLDCQWVDVSELEPGSYILKVAVNPEFKIGEMSFENNAAICNLLYTSTYARVDNCRHVRP